MLSKNQKMLYLVECLNRHYLIFKSGATVLDCAVWLNCSKPTAQKYLAELYVAELVRVQNSGNKRMFFSNYQLTRAEHENCYIVVRKTLKGF